MRKSTRFLAMLLAVLMAVSAFPMSVFAVGGLITEVDMTELVTETKFLYSGDTTNGVWSSNTSCEVTNPTFYSELTVSVNDGEYESLGGFTWTVPEDYDATAIGSKFTFTAVAPVGFEFADGVAPTITAEIVDGAVSYEDFRGGIITNHEKPINVVLKDNKVYDATGCNLMYADWTSEGRFLFGAALTSMNTGLTRTDAFTAPEYDTSIYATGAINGGVYGGGVEVNLVGDTNVVVENATLTGKNVGQIYGGGLVRYANKTATVTGDTHVTVSGTEGTGVYGGGWSYVSTNDTSVTGDTYITVSDSTFNTVYGGGNGYAGKSNVSGTANITISDSNIGSVYGGGYANNKTAGQANVGSANIDISGNVTINKISGAGYNNGKGYVNVTGTVTVNIHDLAGTATIGTIMRGTDAKATAAKLVVNLDDTSAHLVSVIEGLGTDVATEAYINGEKFVGVIADADLADIPEAMATGTASIVLPTTFGELSGFTWAGDDATAGEKTFTLTAPAGYFFEGYSKTKEYTIEVTSVTVEVAGVTLDKNTANIKVGEEITLKATVLPENASNPTVTWTASENVSLSATTGNKITVTAVADGEATVTATAGSVSATCVVTIEKAIAITAVDTENLVLQTKFLYSADTADETNRWSSTNYSNVTQPKFYDTLTVSVNGGEMAPLSGFDWVCETYDSTAVGKTFTFKAVAPEGYAFGNSVTVPTISVKIVPGTLFRGADHIRVVTSEKEAVNLVVKGDSGIEGYPNMVYDATGFNNLFNFTGTSSNVSNGVASSPTTAVYGGPGKTSTGIGSANKIYTGEIGYETKITVTGGADLVSIYAATRDLDQSGDAYVDVYGKVTIKTIYGGTRGGETFGTTYLNIYDLDDSSTINSIKRDNAAKLVVKLDDSSKHLLSGGKIKGVTTAGYTDTAVQVYINGEKFVGVTDVPDEITVPAYVVKGTASEVLPEIPGFTWTYDDSTLGDKVFTLTADEGYFFDGLVKSKSYNVTVTANVVEVTDITLDKNTANIKVGEKITLKATVSPDNASNPTVTWTASENVSLSATTGNEITVTAVADGEATVTATAGSVSATCAVTIEKAIIITAVDTENLVLETKFLYSADTTDATNRWSSTNYSNVTQPKFYDTLTVSVNGGEMAPLSGFDWVCETYDSTAVGKTFTFKAVAPEGYAFGNSVTVPTISVKIVPGTLFRGADHIRVVTSEKEAVNLVVKGDSGIEGYPNMVYDATGCNNLFNFTGTSSNVSNGVASSPTTAVYGGPGKTSTGIGSANKIYTGEIGYETKITVTGGADLVSVYAATRDLDQSGDAYVDVYGKVTIGTVYGGTRGGETFGTTYVNIYDLDDNATINSITRDNAAKLVVNLDETSAHLLGSIKNWKTDENTEVIIHVTSDFDLNFVEDIKKGLVTVYVDGVLLQYVTQVEMPQKSVFNATLGTEAEDLGLPATLTATINEKQSTINNVTWACENYDANKAGKYIFKPVISDAYDMSGSNIADISVVVRVLSANAGQLAITGFAPIDAVSVTLGTLKEDVVLPSTVTATVNGQSVPVEVDGWTCDGVYDGSVYGAEYTYTAIVSGEYALAVSAPTIVVKIIKGKIVEIYLPVTETTFPRGTVANPVFYDTLKVKLDNGTVVDMPGFEWTVKDYNKNALGTYTATINSAPENCEFAASIKVPAIKVTVTNKKYNVFTLDSHVYLNGIPTVIDGTSSATYLYDMTGCNKTDPANIAGKTVFGGGPSNSVSLKTTLVEMRGGKIGTIYGSSRNNSKITDTAYIYVLGGTVGSIYGGGFGGTTAATVAVTQNSYVYVENANVTTRASAAGYNGSIEGDATFIVKNATVNGIYGGSYAKKTVMPVEGTSTIKLLDGAKVPRIYGSGLYSTVNELEIYLSKNAVVTTRLDPSGQSNVKGTSKIFFETGFDLSTLRAEEENVKLYEGHFLEDRETFVTDREIQIIRQPGLVRGDFYVDYGTALEDIGLPTTVEGEIDENPATVSGITYTPVNNYDGNKPGRYEFKLNVPDGYNIPYTSMKLAGTVTVVVTEAAQSGNVTAILEGDTGYTVANGTAIENVGLPSAYTATVSGVNKTIPVKSWTVTDENGRSVTYDRYTAGTYVFTPEFDSGYTVSAELPTHTVKLSAYRPYREGNTRYLNGIPADIAGMVITDKNGNYLENAGTYTLIYGGSNRQVLDSTDVTLNSGTVRAIYGGSSKYAVEGEVKVTVNGGTVTYLYTGSAGGSVQSINVTINGGTITDVTAGNACNNAGGIRYEVNGGTITNFHIGDLGANGNMGGTKQEADEVLALSTEKDKGPIVVKEGELISAVFVQNGGTIKSLYGGGKAANSINGSVKIYINDGKVTTICGGGYVQTATTMENVYIVVSQEAECKTIYANAPGSIYGKAYVVVPDDFNRYDILGWNENDSDNSDDSNVDIEDDDAYLDEGYVSAEVIVSGGRYEEGSPVRIVYMGTTQTVFARGVPIKIVGQSPETEEDEETEVSTYVWYFDENYNAETETPETFSYETYVDVYGNPLVLTGVWRRMSEPLASGATAVIYGGGMQGTTDKYPSTYVEFNSGYVKGIYGGGKNNTVGTANVVLDAEGSYNAGAVYGGGYNSASQITNNAHIKVLRGSYTTFYAGGYNVTTNNVQVDVEGGSVNRIYMGSYAKAGIITGTVTLNLTNCTVGTVYGGGYDTSSTTIGAVYINVNENVNITGYVYPKGSGERGDKEESGAVKREAYVTLNDTDSVSSQFKKIKYTKAQAPFVYVNGVAMGEVLETSLASFETAEKKVEITSAESSDYRGNRSIVFLNGIPTVISGDGNGHSYLYQAKTKDGTPNAYQKNADGTFKYDENGERISNIVRDPVTGQAIKGSKLVDVDVIDYVVYGGANGRSVEDVYVEFHVGGGMWVFYAGCRGGHAGYDSQGNEVGLVEVRQFGGGPFDELHMGSALGYDVEGNQTVNVLVSKTVFLGISGGTKQIALAGLAGTIGNEEKFIDGYYNKAGEIISYTDPDDNQVYEITGTWEDYNLDVTKEDYEEYYESTNARHNGEDNTDFLENDFYVDPYDDHCTVYALLADYSVNNLYMGTYGTEYNASRNRVYGNTYFRQSAYGLKYDAELDMFVEDYNDYLGLYICNYRMYDGCNTGVMYSDIRHDHEAILTPVFQPLGKSSTGAINYGHTYVNLYETDTNPIVKDELYKKLTVKTAANLTVKQNFFPRWSHASAWALCVDEDMPQIAIDKGYITEVTDPEDVRISMLSAEDAARLLNYYYVGSFDEFVTTENEQQSEGYRSVFDASDDAGKFVIRHFEGRLSKEKGINRYIDSQSSHFGDSQLITFPNGETMLIDVGQNDPQTLIRDIKYILQQYKEQGIGDGKTIDYFVITHPHGDHQGNATAVLRALDIKNLVLPPYDGYTTPGYYAVVESKSEQYVAQGKDPINIIRVQRGDKIVIGEGDEAVTIDVINPGDHSYRTYSLAEAIRRIKNGTGSSFYNPCGIGTIFTFKGQRYYSCADIKEDAEQSMMRTYGADYLKCDVMKLSHHGHASSSIYPLMNATNPDVTIQDALNLHHANASVPAYLANNNTGGYAENVFATAIAGAVKVTLDGENVTSVTQFKNRAYERDTDEYKNLESNYTSLLDRVEDTREALTVVADNATAPYGTPYMWNSHANYIDSQLEELSKRYYSGTMTSDMLEDYTDKLEALEQFIDDATMYGGNDTTPDVEVPGTDEGGSETTTPGTSGGIIGDIGGGDAGAGIGGGAVVVPEGPSTDDGEDDRRFIDVATTDWFNNAVNYVADNNYFQGVSENQFDPSGKMTRVMLVTVIGRMAKADTSEAVNNFTDVEDGSWYAGYVAWAAENGIVTGVGEGKFAPNDNVTREQIAAILMRYATYKGIDVSVDSTEKYDSMKDTASVSEYAVEALKWATANAVINGAEGNINPRGNATRAEVAQMIMNFCNTFSV